LHGVLLLLATVAGSFVVFILVGGSTVLSALLSLAFQFTVGLNGNSWRSRRLEQSSYKYAGAIVAKSAPAALAAFARGIGTTSGASYTSPSFFSVPGWLQRLLAIAWLTWKAALRFRLFLVIAALLIASVIGLPILIKDDGTARGFTQILLTYTLSTITALLGLSTLWLSCGTLARDIEECQMQMVAVKPIARWQIWFGKWLGILSLNAVLLALTGGCVYGLLQWRAKQLPATEQAVLNNEILVARGSAKERNSDDDIESEAARLLQERLQKNPELTRADLTEVRKQIVEQVKAVYQLVPPGYERPWKIDLGLRAKFLRDQPLQLRVKFNSAEKSPSGTFVALWQVGEPQKTKLWRSEPMSLAPDTFHEFTIPPNLFDENGVLTITFANPNNTALLFPLGEGMEVLYHEGGFGLNFARGLGIILCWMALLSAIGLCSASFLSFPVAAFFSLGVLTMAFSTGTLSNVVSEGTIMSRNSETGVQGSSTADLVVVPFFRAALGVINLAKGFSPIDSLSSGRSITWTELGLAFGQIVLLLGGIFALFGIFVFNRRELATAQGTQ
jgi:ABC-type transport system involved in multi-copper enzyme maturation permease subunit